MSSVRDRVSIIGSGNWGSAISRIVGVNVKKYSERFDPNVSMWVFQEKVNGKNLTDIINKQHENVKYMPGISIPDNINAIPDVGEAVKDATILVFVLPEQFLHKVCDNLAGKLYNGGKEVKAISLIKGIDVQGNDIKVTSQVISEKLGISCASLSGANIATEVAREKFCETTIGTWSDEEKRLWKDLFDAPYFRVSVIQDVNGVGLCGALKNVVALAAGFVDGMGWGSNSKAAVMRIGLMEMKRFSQEFYEGVKEETFVSESAGVADLITTCIGGRNRKCAEAFVTSKKSFEDLEHEMLNGQKLQGTVTAKQLYRFLYARGKHTEYPLFHTVYQIAFEGLPAKNLTSKL